MQNAMQIIMSTLPFVHIRQYIVGAAWWGRLLKANRCQGVSFDPVNHTRAKDTDVHTHSHSDKHEHLFIQIQAQVTHVN